jgi:hypothetical protein
VRRLISWARVLLALGGLGWATYSGAVWLRYGRTHRATGAGEDPLDSFIPDPEVDEEHETRVAAPAAFALKAAKQIDLQRSPLVRLIFGVRMLPARLRGRAVRWEGMGLVEQMLGIGWGVLIDTPEELIVAGAVTRPWATEVKFRALAPKDFVRFDEPGYVKIIWTLEAEALSEHESVARTRTRVKTTDASARKRFRRYWALLSPGILLIRHELLRLVRQEVRRLAATGAR